MENQQGPQTNLKGKARRIKQVIRFIDRIIPVVMLAGGLCADLPADEVSDSGGAGKGRERHGAQGAGLQRGEGLLAPGGNRVQESQGFAQSGHAALP